MKTKFLLPALAMIFAIGMSFTTLDKVEDPSQDYILQNGSFTSIGTELNCGQGTMVCKVQLPDGSIYQVYDSANANSLKKGDGDIRKLN